MSNQPPMFSVVMPAYNAEQYVGEAIESVLAQSMPSWELLVVDDCSTDKTLEICRSYRDSRIRVFSSPQNLNAAGARNLALEHARGEFVAFLDSDDVAVPDRLERQHKALLADPELGFLGSQVCLINEGEADSRHKWIYPEQDAEIKAAMLFRCPFVISTVAVRRSLLKKFGNKVFFPEIAPSEDYHLGARLLGLCKFYNDPNPFSFYRLHSGQLTQEKANLIGQQMLKVQCHILSNIGIEMTNENLELHRLCNKGDKQSLEQLKSAKKWLEEIYNSNCVTKLIPENGIRSSLGITWFHLCKQQKSKSLILYREYKKSKLSGFYHSRRSEIQFLLECIFKKQAEVVS